MWERLFSFVVDAMIACFLPLVCLYHILTSDLFLNVAIEEAPFLEKAGNTFLIPLQYICDGKLAIHQNDGSWKLIQRFDYTTAYWTKTAGCAIVLPVSVLFGTLLKAISFCNEKTRVNYASLVANRDETKSIPNTATYIEMGMHLSEPVEWLECQNYKRRPGDEKHLDAMKRCLKEISVLFNEAKIPWWVDCGSCLGALRHGGVIPWDNDIDIAVMVTDFENVRRTLNQLDRTKYFFQDWSGRDKPNSFFKIYIRESSELFDIYFYEIDPIAKEFSYIFALDSNIFFPEWWKERERRFIAPTSFDSVFPLKRAFLDGVEVFVPNKTVKFLQRYYGENLQPARIYDEDTGRYEKDLSHPYWKMSYVH